MLQDTKKWQIAKSLSTFYPNHVLEKKKVKTLAIIGGELRSDKFRVIDQLIDIVSFFYYYFFIIILLFFIICIYFFIIFILGILLLGSIFFF
jgi:hypothetical protein